MRAWVRGRARQLSLNSNSGRSGGLRIQHTRVGDQMRAQLPSGSGLEVAQHTRVGARDQGGAFAQPAWVGGQVHVLPQDRRTLVGDRMRAQVPSGSGQEVAQHTRVGGQVHAEVPSGREVAQHIRVGGQVRAEVPAGQEVAQHARVGQVPAEVPSGQVVAQHARVGGQVHAKAPATASCQEAAEFDSGGQAPTCCGSSGPGPDQGATLPKSGGRPKGGDNKYHVSVCVCATGAL